MTGREVFVKALNLDNPPRIAMALPDPYPNDLCRGWIGGTEDSRATGWTEVAPDREERMDEWGNLWWRLEGRSKGEVHRGAIENWDDLPDYTPPDYDLPERYEDMRERFRENPDKFRIGGLPGFPFNIARKMRRLDNFLVDVVAEPERVRELLALVEEQLHHAIRRYAEVGADGIMFPEDWGTQDRLLVSPRTFKDLFKPGFERLCATAHENGLFVLMHSCGYIYEAMDDMIEAGIDCFQFDQPTIYGIERLAEEFGDRVSFWCPVDIQHTLQTRDREAIEADARKMVELLGRGGGFIAGYYGGNDAIGLDPRWQDIACREFVRVGSDIRRGVEDVIRKPESG